jgi:phosphoenolpyruvate carboxylase
MSTQRSTPTEIRRFRVKHALRSIEDALSLLEDKPAEGIETTALKRVREDLAVVLRTLEPAR